MEQTLSLWVLVGDLFCRLRQFIGGSAPAELSISGDSKGNCSLFTRSVSLRPFDPEIVVVSYVWNTGG